MNESQTPLIKLGSLVKLQNNSFGKVVKISRNGITLDLGGRKEIVELSIAQKLEIQNE